MFTKMLCRLAVASSVAIFTSISTATAQEVIKWDLLGYLGINSPSTKLLVDFANDVETRTNGKLRITVRSAGELPYPAADYHRVVGRGDVQMADTAWLSGDIPATGALTLPFLVQNFTELRTAMNAISPIVNAGLERFGAQALFYYSFPVANFWGTGQAPKDIASFRGRKIRGLTPEHSELISALGAAPATIATPEVMTALQYGTIDTAITSAYGLTGAKWDSLIKWTFTVDLAPSPSFVIVNREALEALPEDVRTVLEEVAMEHQDKMLNAIERDEFTATAALIEKKLKVIKASDTDRSILTPIAEELWQRWPEGRGEGAQEAFDAIHKALKR